MCLTLPLLAAPKWLSPSDIEISKDGGTLYLACDTADGIALFDVKKERSWLNCWACDSLGRIQRIGSLECSKSCEAKKAMAPDCKPETVEVCILFFTIWSIS